MTLLTAQEYRNYMKNQRITCKLCKKYRRILLWCDSSKLLICEHCHESIHCGMDCSSVSIHKIRW